MLIEVFASHGLRAQFTLDRLFWAEVVVRVELIPLNLDRAVLTKYRNPFANFFVVPDDWLQSCETAIRARGQTAHHLVIALLTVLLVVVVFDQFLATVVNVVASEL